MGLLHSIQDPGDLRRLSERQLVDLAQEIRAFLVEKCSRTGGHLGPNLGVVELTLALHRVFDSPRDRIVFDTGHQAYVHKILTGRADGFDRLRQDGGLSGYPSQAESPHDIVENSHASTALSYADGLAKAFSIRGEDRHVVAVVGDGALTGGMAWEALNNIAANHDRKLVIVVNDNGRSYTPTVGGLAEHLTSLRTNPRYEKVLDELAHVHVESSSSDCDGRYSDAYVRSFEELGAADTWTRAVLDVVSPSSPAAELKLSTEAATDWHGARVGPDLPHAEWNESTEEGHRYAELTLCYREGCEA